MTVSVIVMTLNAEKTLDALLCRLEQQTLPPCEILVADSESDDGTAKIAAAHPFVKWLTIPRKTFDHGGSRHQALLASHGDVVCFLTQDALPADERYLEQLTAAFADPDVACVCGRQVADPAARPEEKLTRQFNYPAESCVRSREDVARLGIKAYFFSDACSAYRRQDYLAAGGFARPLLTNEDMLMAAAQLKRGKKIAYCAEAKVWHSHGYSLAQDYRRSFDIGVFLKQHQDDLPGRTANHEGLRYVRWVSVRLLKKARLCSLVRFFFHCAARYLGSRAGSRYERMSRERILRRTGQRAYWLREDEAQPAKERSL